LMLHHLSEEYKIFKVAESPLAHAFLVIQPFRVLLQQIPDSRLALKIFECL